MKRMIAVLICIGLIAGSWQVAGLAQGETGPVLLFQMVPCGNRAADNQGFNGWCDSLPCESGVVNHYASSVRFSSSPAAGDKLNYLFCAFMPEDSSPQDFTVVIQNARVETADGSIIALDGLNGTYRKPASGNMICDFRPDGIDAGLFYLGLFKADVTVNFGNFEDYAVASAGAFPDSGIVNCDSSVITLRDVQYDGALTFTGTKYPRGVTLLLEGNSAIAGLNVQCPLKIATIGEASLTCQIVNDPNARLTVLPSATATHKGAATVFSCASPTVGLQSLAGVTFSGVDHVLPDSRYCSVAGNTITLQDFHFDGSVNLTGGGYDSLKLVLKGNCTIGSLVMNCPVTIERYSYTDLTCDAYSANATVTTDQNTSVAPAGGKTVIGFTLQSGHQPTQIYSSESSGFPFRTVESGSEPYCYNAGDLAQYAQTAVAGVAGYQQGYRMSFNSGSMLSIDLTAAASACSAEEKVVLSMYARVVSANPDDTAWGYATLNRQNPSDNRYSANAFHFAGETIPLTTQWQRFTFSGFLSKEDPSYPNLTLFLGCKTGGATVEYCGVELLAQSSLTATELDELTGVYDYDWRHADAPWHTQAQEMIADNRTGNLLVHLTDGNGNPINGAKVTVDQTDYAYEFGVSSGAGGILNSDGGLSAWLNRIRMMGGNALIDYTDIAWENFFDDGAANSTYDFDRFSGGDVDFVSAAVKTAQKNDITFATHQLIYPSFDKMRSNTQCTDNYDQLVQYVLSDGYSPQGFKQYIEDHIKQVVTSYAGVIKIWGVVNEAFYSKDFFKLIYGTDGTGISRAAIQAVTASYSTNGQKIAALESWLNTDVPIAPAPAAGKYIAAFCDAALEAWTAAGCDPDELTLYYNDAPTKENDHDLGVYYAYVTDLANELAKPQNYAGGKVLIKRIGFEFADWGYTRISPQEVWSILDEFQAIGFPVFFTEFNYYLDNPVSSDGSRLSDYGMSYNASGCGSQAELEYMGDYTEAVLTAMYAHSNSRGVYASTYPHGMIGYIYPGSSFSISPLGSTFQNLVQNRWHTSGLQGETANGSFAANGVALGKYTVTVEYGGRSKRATVEVNGKTSSITLSLPRSYTMSFDSQGGGSVPSKTVESGAAVTTPNEPAWMGHTFDGWFKEPTCSNRWNFPSEQMPSSDVTLYAKWTTNRYTVTFRDWNGVTLSSGPVEYGSAAAAPAAPGRTGYTFTDWDKDFRSVSSDLIVTAQYCINRYTIAYDSQEGGAVAGSVADYGSKLTAPADPVLAGHTFGGWYKDPGCTALWDFATDTVSGDTTLYARWNINSYTVHSDARGGNGPADFTVPFGGRIAQPAVPVRATFDFTGWYRDAGCSVLWNFDGDTVTDNTILYAGWAAQPQVPTLNGLALSAGRLTKAFSAKTSGYTVQLGENEGAVTVTPDLTYDGATMTIDGKKTAAKTVSLANGKSAATTIKVTLGKKSTTYKLTIQRAKSTTNVLAALNATAGMWSQSFDPNVTSYALTLPENVTKVTLNAARASGLSTVAPAKASYSLKNGQTVKAMFKVKAQSGATRTYTVVITRAKSTNANLASLKSSVRGMIPGFSSTVMDYSVMLSDKTTSTTLTVKAADSLSKVTINGAKKSSLTVKLANGQSTTVIITVMAQSGDVKTYAVTVIR